MKNRGGLGDVVRSFGQGMVDAITVIKEPLNSSKTSYPGNDAKKLRNDIQRAGYKTLHDRQLTCKSK